MMLSWLFHRYAWGRGENCFPGFLKARFDSAKTAENIVKIMEGLQLPLPQHGKEFVRASRGALLFLNDFGIVIRIEDKDASKITNESPWVLRPIARYTAGRAIIEICPGTHSCNDEKMAQALGECMQKDGIALVDGGAHNAGILPYKAPAFPDGVPLVIDRPAVDKLAENVAPVAEALHRAGLSEDPQQVLYGALAQAFRDAWVTETKSFDPEKIKAAWQLCREHLADGKLVAGWNEERDNKYRILDARKSAIAYSARIKR